MKKLIVYTALSCCAAAASAQAIPDGRVAAHDAAAAYADGKITVSMQLDPARADLHRTESIVLTPVIKTAGKEQALTPVVVSGRNRMKSDRRAARFRRALPYNSALAQKPDGMIPYNATTAYEPWMAGASLILKENVYGCALKHISSGSAALMTLRGTEPVKPSIKPAVTYVVPAVEAVKNRDMNGTAFLDFPAGKAVILADFRDNAGELNKIRTMVERLRADKAVTTDSIVLRGYASPEGSYTVNMSLSERRAAALKDYMVAAYGLHGSLVLAVGLGEDWDGLASLVESSDKSYKRQALDIIRGTGVFDGREKKLMNLQGGVPYRDMLAEMFPRLRRVEYRLDYTVRGFSVEEGKEKIRTNPGQMSLNEMFLVANAYPKGSDKFKQVFDIAVRIFPADKVANINEAAMLLERGDAAAARRYLEPYASDPAAWNNLGVMYMLEGDYAQARTFFGKAAGTPEAALNLDMLPGLEEYEKAKAAWSAYSK